MRTLVQRPPLAPSAYALGIAVLLAVLCSPTTAQCPSSLTSPASFSSGSGNYASNLRCEFSLSNPGAFSLSLLFSKFRIAAGDWLAIYDGNSATDPLLGNYTGIIPPPPLKTTTAKASFFVVFQSNADQIVDLGFDGTFGADRCVAGNRTLASIRGTIDDGTPAGQLYNNMNGWCYWIFAPPTYLAVTSFIVNFIRFDVVSSDFGSKNDYVSFWEGAGSEGRLIGSFNGGVVPKSIKINSGVFTMGFFKSWDAQAAGFQINFNANSNVGCAGDPIVLSGPRGSFTHGSSGNYLNNMQCSFLIKGGASNAQSLFFNSIALDIGDVLKVYDGDSASDPLIGTFTNTRYVPVIKSSTPKRSLLVVLTTDSSDNNGGFSADYYSDYCRNAVSIGSTLSDVIDDGTPSGQLYDNINDNCIYNIAAPASAAVTSWTISFDFIDIVSSPYYAVNDYLNIYSGVGISGPLVAGLSGNVVPNSIRVMSSAFTVLFFKSSDGNARGWRLRFYANSDSFGCSPWPSPLLLAGPRGRFSSGTDSSYLHDLRCQYLLKGSASSFQSLFFSDVSIGTGGYVTVYDGDSTKDPLIANFTGLLAPGPIRSSSLKNSLFVEFVTGASNGTGWKADYFSDQCRGTVVTSALQGWISDGTPPGQQYNNIGDWCYWIVQPPAGASVSNYIISFETFDILSSDFGSENDYLMIWDGVGTTGAVVANRWNGNVVPSSVITSQAAFTVGFYASPSKSASGFRFQFNAQSSKGCLPRTTFSGPRGTFTHGTSGQYLNDQNCEFLITGATYSVALFISSFRLKPNDWFAVFDGDSRSDPLIGNFSGNVPPPPMASTSAKRSLLVVFNTDGSDTDTGFSANYGSDFCNHGKATGSPYGTFTDGTPPGQQYNNMNGACQWLINPPQELGVNQFTITFPKFGLVSSPFGSDHDYVTAYIGTSTAGAVIGTWSGSTNPGTITVAASAIVLLFYKSPAAASSGFTMSYTTNTACDQPILTSSVGSYSWSLLPGSPILCDSAKRWLIRPSVSAAALTVWLSDTIITDDNQINIYDGALPLPALRLASYTKASSLVVESRASNPIYSTGGAVLVEYLSRTPVPPNAGQKVPRFTVSYQNQCQGTLTLSDSVGVIADGSGGDNYPANTICQWRITPTQQTAVVVTLQSSQIALSGTSSISFFDGPGPSAPLIFRLNSTNINQLNCPFIQSSGPALFVSFSAGASSGGGFSFSYTSGLCNSPASSAMVLTSAPSGSFAVSNLLQPLQPCTILLSPQFHIYSKLKLNLMFLNFTGSTRMNVYDGSNIDPDRLLRSYSSADGSGALQLQPSTAYRGAMLLEIVPDSNTTLRTSTLVANFEGSSLC